MATMPAVPNPDAQEQRPSQMPADDQLGHLEMNIDWQEEKGDPSPTPQEHPTSGPLANSMPAGKILQHSMSTAEILKNSKTAAEILAESAAFRARELAREHATPLTPTEKAALEKQKEVPRVPEATAKEAAAPATPPRKFSDWMPKDRNFDVEFHGSGGWSEDHTAPGSALKPPSPLASSPSPDHSQDFEENFDTNEAYTKNPLPNIDRVVEAERDIPTALELSKDPKNWANPKVAELRKELLAKANAAPVAPRTPAVPVPPAPQENFEENFDVPPTKDVPSKAEVAPRSGLRAFAHWLNGPHPEEARATVLEKVRARRSPELQKDIAAELRRRAGLEVGSKRSAYIGARALLDDEARYEKFPGGRTALNRLLESALLRNPIYPADTEALKEEEAKIADANLPADVRLAAALARSPIQRRDPAERTIPGTPGQEVGLRKAEFIDHIVHAGQGQEFAERLYSAELARISYEHERVARAREAMTLRTEELLNEQAITLQAEGKDLMALSPEAFAALRARVKQQVRKEIFRDHIVKEAEVYAAERLEKNPYRSTFEKFQDWQQRFSNTWGRFQNKLAELGLRPTRGIELERRAAVEALARRFTTETGPLERMKEYESALRQLIEKKQTNQWNVRLRRGALTLAMTMGLGVLSDVPSYRTNQSAEGAGPARAAVHDVVPTPIRTPAPETIRPLPAEAPANIAPTSAELPPTPVSAEHQTAEVETGPLVTIVPSRSIPGMAVSTERSVPVAESVPETKAAPAEVAGPELSEIERELPPREPTKLEKDMDAEAVAATPKEAAPERVATPEAIEAVLQEKFATEREAMNEAGREYLVSAFQKLAEMNPKLSLAEIAGDPELMDVHVKMALAAGNLTAWETQTMHEVGLPIGEYVSSGYVDVIRNMRVNEFLAHFQNKDGTFNEGVVGQGTNFIWNNTPTHWRIAPGHLAFAKKLAEAYEKAGSSPGLSVADLVRQQGRGE